MDCCNWVRYFGNYHFNTSCGQIQGINIRPKQKICFCGKQIKRFVQTQDGIMHEVVSVRVNKGNAYYYC